MNIESYFFDAREYASNLRCTIQRSGKIGFSGFTQDKLKIGEQKCIRIGIDGKRDSFKHLLLHFLDTDEKSAFKINRAGSYYYINPKALLDDLGIVYKERNILFDMLPLDDEKKIYKLIRREDKNSNEEIDNENT